ncbi:MAG: HAD family hydrolase [Candidatus Dormibacteria bacterium]
MTIRHVVWDWNGTLLDDVALIAQVTSATLLGHGVEPLDVDGYRRVYRRPIGSLYEHLLGRSLEPDEFARLDADWHAHYAAGLDGCALFPGVVDALAEVERRGWSQSLCSMFPHGELPLLVERLGIGQRFLRIDGVRGERGGRKQAHLQEHLDALGLGGPETVVIGDSLDDAEAALGCGAHAVLLTTGLHQPDDLRSAGVPVCEGVLAALDAVQRSDEIAAAPAG